MLYRWLKRYRWRRSYLFEEEVEFAIDDVKRSNGADALAQARRKAARRQQPVHRKWIWREVVRRLEAEERDAARRPAS